MKLEDWRVERSLSYAALAEMIGHGVTPKMAERYCKGTIPRDERVMVRIGEMTGQIVMPNDWWDMSSSPIDEAACGQSAPEQQKAAAG